VSVEAQGSRNGAQALHGINRIARQQRATTLAGFLQQTSAIRSFRAQYQAVGIVALAQAFERRALRTNSQQRPRINKRRCWILGRKPACTVRKANSELVATRVHSLGDLPEARRKTTLVCCCTRPRFHGC
jgi:hypothetical protein